MELYTAGGHRIMDVYVPAAQTSAWTKNLITHLFVTNDRLAILSE